MKKKRSIARCDFGGLTAASRAAPLPPLSTCLPVASAVVVASAAGAIP